MDLLEHGKQRDSGLHDIKGLSTQQVGTKNALVQINLLTEAKI
jgi:hypothetical protein